MVIPFGSSAKIAGAETASMYKDLEEGIDMEYPQWMNNVGENDSIILNKCIYGLVQATRQYYKKVIKILKKWDSAEAMPLHEKK